MYELKPAPPMTMRVRQRSPEALAMKEMKPGDFFLIANPKRVNAARCAVRTLRDKRFVIAKMDDGSGWGVWCLPKQIPLTGV